MGKTFFVSSVLTFICGAAQCLWHNKYIKIDDKTIFSSSLSAKGINFVGQLFWKQILRNYTESITNLVI